jgi:glycosyltransferase involved in cell wall biosynthesis
VRTSLEPAVQRAIEEGAIRLLGGIDDAELAWLFGHAELFVFLSLDEGFGLPPVEALSFGCPVLASDIPVLRETLGDRATFVDPTDPSAIAAAFQALDPPPARSAPVSTDWGATVRRLRSAIDGGGGGAQLA